MQIAVLSCAVADPAFSREGANREGDYYLTKFFQKLHENEEILVEMGGVPCVPLGPPMVSLLADMFRTNWC